MCRVVLAIQTLNSFRSSKFEVQHLLVAIWTVAVKMVTNEESNLKLNENHNELLRNTTNAPLSYFLAKKTLSNRTGGSLFCSDFQKEAEFRFMAQFS